VIQVTVTRVLRSKLFRRYRLLLSLAQMTVIVGLIVFCMMYAPQGRAQSQTAVLPQFEVASIKPSKLITAGDNNSESIDMSPGGRLTLSNIRLSSCLKWAYGVQDPQISGPGGLDLERYDIVAQAPGPTAEGQLKLMMRSLLADRFKLALHYEEKALTAYVLVVAKNGPKFRRSEGEGKSDVRRTQVGVTAEKISMKEFADLLSGQLRSPVADKTGLKGAFDLAFDLRQYIANESTPVSISSLILQAMEDQLGLKLQAAKTAVQVIVIDHLEKPSAN
jgi:uncharacterized protein (TIGR03435 family)